MHLNPRTAPPRRGFTLIEVLVTLTIVGILMAAAAPAFAGWVRNARIRSAAQALQDGLRFAQAEATRRNRQTVFALTAGSVNVGNVLSNTATTTGGNFVTVSVPLLTSDNPTFVQAGTITDTTKGIVISGPSAVCFNSAGRLVANAAPGLPGAVCSIDPSTPLKRFDVTLGNGDRPLRVTVSLAGQVRSCDPARTLSAAAADGCPVP